MCCFVRIQIFVTLLAISISIGLIPKSNHHFQAHLLGRNFNQSIFNFFPFSIQSINQSINFLKEEDIQTYAGSKSIVSIVPETIEFRFGFSHRPLF